MRFDYKLDGAGWATATLGNDSREVVMTVSYLHDSLGQLARAVLELADGQPEASVVFMDEPGEHQLVLTQSIRGRISVEVRWFRDWASWSMHPSDEYEIVYEDSVSLQDLRTEVGASLGWILQRLGTKGYRKKWIEHEFPVDDYRKIVNL
jgi:hypothetical protein